MTATVRTVMLKELRECLRDRRTLVNSLLIGPILAPIFFILVLKLALARSVAGQDEAAPVTVVNAAAAPNLVQQLREHGLDVSLREGTERDIRAWIAAENELVVMRVPDSYGERFTELTANWLLSKTLAWLTHLEARGLVQRVGEGPERWAVTA